MYIYAINFYIFMKSTLPKYSLCRRIKLSQHYHEDKMYIHAVNFCIHIYAINFAQYSLCRRIKLSQWGQNVYLFNQPCPSILFGGGKRLESDITESWRARTNRFCSFNVTAASIFQNPNIIYWSGWFLKMISFFWVQFFIMPCKPVLFTADH